MLPQKTRAHNIKQIYTADKAMFHIFRFEMVLKTRFKASDTRRTQKK